MTSWREEKQMDASITQMMRACADDEGAMLLKSYEKDLPQPLPVELDDQCKRLIEKTFNRRKNRVVAGHIAKTMCLTLLCLFGLVGIGTVAAMSMESLREPVHKVFENYRVDITDEKLSVSGEAKEFSNGSKKYGEISSDVLLKILPEGYEYQTEAGESIDWYLAILQGEKYGEVGVSLHNLGATIRVNTEGAWLLEEIELRGCSAYLIGMNRYTAISWVDEARGISGYLSAERITLEEIVALAEQFIDQLPEVEQPPTDETSEQSGQEDGK